MHVTDRHLTDSQVTSESSQGASHAKHVNWKMQMQHGKPFTVDFWCHLAALASADCCGSALVGFGNHSLAS